MLSANSSTSDLFTDTPQSNPGSQADSSSRIKLRHFLTLRSYALLTFALFLITGPVPDHSDLFAAVLGYSLLLILVLTVVSTFLIGWWLQSQIDCKITYDISRAHDGKPTSEAPVSLFVRLVNASLPPLFSLQVTPRFAHPTITVPWKVTGNITEHTALEQPLQFQHRGNWELSYLIFELRDTFGLSRFRWIFSRLHSLRTFTIFPPRLASRNLPPFTAQTTSGIELSELQRSEGDPYDIKRYHPSDGIRKILWKTYAKSGELLSRHPEPSMTPEGTVAIFGCLRSHDDPAAGLVLSHLKDLSHLDFQFFFTTDGAKNSDVVTSLDTAEKLLIDTAWTADDSTTQDRLAQIHEIDQQLTINSQNRLQQITLFTSAHSLTSDGELERCTALGKELHQQQIDILWIVLRSGVIKRDEFTEEGFLSTVKKLALIQDVQELEAEEEISLSEMEGEALSIFSSICEQNNWKIIITR